MIQKKIHKNKYELLPHHDYVTSELNIKLVVSVALHSMTTTVVIAHNHPSGSLKPCKTKW
jgi:DNA repair protein RadC